MHTGLLLEMAADGMGDRIAVGRIGSGLTYADLLGNVRRASAALSRHEGMIVHVGLNSPALQLGLFSAGQLGRPFSPLNYRLPDADLRKILARTAPSIAIVDDTDLHRVQGVEGVTILPRSEFLALAAAHDAQIEESGADPEGIAVLLFTSGTTGEPKAAVLRHRHLTSYVMSTADFMGSDEDDAALVSVPPYHIAGIAAALGSVWTGRRVVQLEHFTPEDWVRLAEEERVSHAMVVPTMLGRILDVIERDSSALPNLRHLSYGGGRMPLSTIERALRILPGVDFVNAYGLTETSSTIAVLHPEDHRTALASEDPTIRRRLGSVGQPLPGLELDIRDTEGNPVPVGEPGEIWVRGEQVSGEYLSHRAVRDDGWFPTKDAGSLDEHGYLYIEGRLDDVIVRGGENISPGEIEEVLRSYDGITDAAVLGLPDKEWGERIVAVLACDKLPDTDALKAFVRARLRSTKTPEQFFRRDALPYNETGKLLRRVLRDELA